MNERSFYILAYDIPDDRRRAKVARLCESIADRVQGSVFEGYLAPRELEKILQKKQPRIIHNLELYLEENPNSKSSKILVEEGIRSSFACLLMVENRIVGFLFRSSKKVNAYSVRDAGWVMLFAKDLQEAIDLHILAYRIAEEISLPVMVNVDGFYITHTTEAVDIPKQIRVDKFLPEYKPKDYLDVKNPKTFGILGLPDYYHEVRLELHKKIKKSKKQIINLCKEFERVFGRKVGILNTYKLNDANIVFVSTGSIYGTAREAVDRLRKKGKKIGILDITLFRPFPKEEVQKSLINKKKIIVLNRALSLGKEGILSTEIKETLCGCWRGKIEDVIVGLGGKDMSVDDIMGLV